MRRVHDAVGDGEADGVVAHALEVAAPPGAVELLSAGDGAFDALDEDQPVGSLGEDGIAATLGGAAPVVGCPGAPGGFAVRLVLEVGADHVGRVGVARGQLAPGRHPVVLGVATQAIPERMHEGIVGRGVVVEDDHQALSTGLRDDDVHHLLRRLALQLGVPTAAVINAAGGGRVQHLERERHADRVEAIRLDLGEHLLVVTRPEAVRSVVAGLEAEPVDALEDDLVAAGVNDRAALRLQWQLGCSTGGANKGEQCQQCCGDADGGTAAKPIGFGWVVRHGCSASFLRGGAPLIWLTGEHPVPDAHFGTCGGSHPSVGGRAHSRSPAACRVGCAPTRAVHLHSRQHADVAQLVEHFTRNEGVRGSNPRVGSSPRASGGGNPTVRSHGLDVNLCGEPSPHR